MFRAAASGASSATSATSFVKIRHFIQS